ncbi:hypothetical protein GCM10027280_14150 [Micromonospora polyrhachis]|uniref:ABC-type transport system involved in multi-copper enzyme maturation permease subunit n=1 Tax=Micromonospora polyrhachis TaxID=1282883 RepID=A0A7W7WQC4_9ACTN|nr:ABC transporter permease subunit [Micromonospora polyrhachis]MBB4960151.1 ABC-type transport system involved in multi-copper enzyme maturation permease subunit [Micromonospora polyrhachis]
MNLVRSELLKIRTTNTWWLFGLGALLAWALTFALNAFSAHVTFDLDIPEGLPPEQVEQLQAQKDVVVQATNLFTSGQFFGLLFVTLLGILVVTNEFYHQTATTTFLSTPRRTAVVLAKLVAATLLGAVFWLVTTAINIPATMIFLSAEGVDHHLGDSVIIEALLLNLLAYVLWGIFGVGFGVLIRSQIGATITVVVLYLLGTVAASVLFVVLQQIFEADWILELQVIVPSIASQLMITGDELPGSPPQWVGAAVLIGYAVVTGVAGTLLVRKRDIS